jgi:hypothetical protein
VESFLSFLVGVRLVLESLRVFVLLLVPLMVIEVVAHLPDCLGRRSLILHWHSRQTSIHIELDIVAIQNTFVVFVYLHILETSDPLIVVAC